jgi:hypothetical protein
MATKTTKKSVKKIITPQEKVTTVKIKKVPVKKVIKKSIVQTKKTPTSKVTKKVRTKKVKKDTAELVIALPKKISAEAIVKSNRLRTGLDKYIHQSMYRIAYVSAFCFLIVGATFSLTSLIDTQMKTVYQQAAVVSAVSSATKLDINGVVSLEFSFLTNVPDVVSGPLDINFTASNFSQIRVQLQHLGGDSTSLTYKNIIDNKYSVAIPTASNIGYYELRVYAESKDGEQSQTYASPEFFIGSESQRDDFGREGTQEIDSTVVADIQASPNTQAGTIDDSNNTQEVPGDKTEESASIIANNSNESVANDNADEVVEIEVANLISIGQSGVDKELPKVELPAEVFKLSPQTQTIKGAANIVVILPAIATYAELYYRSLNSLDFRFLSLASERNGNWSFLFDSRNIPDGDYEFVARSDYDDTNKQTRSIKVAIANNQVDITMAEDIITIVEAPEIEEREFVEVDIPVEEPQVTMESEVGLVVTELLNNSKAEFDELLKRYASAVQSGDEMLIAAAKDLLQKKHAEVVFETLQDEDSRYLSDDIAIELQIRVDTLVEKVTVFEELRKEKSGGSSSVDSDEDGISDFDEVNQYKTDPNKADTDNDGISDGIEIVRGFNPTDASPEAVIAFESPKESFGLSRDDVLKVSASPIVTTATTGELEATRTEIRGQGLPNSFVTLYIFSAPTVVTIKTDADGSFVYTFDKELEDGRHDIYVAVTDNAGAIIAQSNPFSFIKTAQAFAPVDAEEDVIVTGATIQQSADDDYVTVVGIAILAFGIILLMLGIGLRTKNEEIDIKKERIGSNYDSVILTDSETSSAKQEKDPNMS